MPVVVISHATPSLLQTGLHQGGNPSYIVLACFLSGSMLVCFAAIAYFDMCLGRSGDGGELEGALIRARHIAAMSMFFLLHIHRW